MNLKKLNEQLDKILRQPINEISDELKQKVIDARQAEYLAAQATADRKKAKFDRISKLGKRLEKKTPETVKTSLVDIAKSLDFEYKEPVVWGEDYVITLIIPDGYIQDGKLTKSAEEELKDLLTEMSDKYGCKYAYKIEKDTVEIICEKPKLDVDKLDRGSLDYYYKIVKPLIIRSQKIFIDLLNKFPRKMPRIYQFDEPFIDLGTGTCCYCYAPTNTTDGFYISSSEENDIEIGYNYSVNTFSDNSYYVGVDHTVSDNELKEIIKNTYSKFYEIYYNNVVTDDFISMIKEEVLEDSLEYNVLDATKDSKGMYHIIFNDNDNNQHEILIEENNDYINIREGNILSLNLLKSKISIERIKDRIEDIVRVANKYYEEKTIRK